MDFLVYLQMLVSLIMLVMVIKRYRDNRRPPPAPADAPRVSAEIEPLNPADLRDPGRNWHLPPPPLPKKPWWRLYGATLCVALGGLAFTSHNAWFVHSNPPPLFEELQMKRVEVIGRPRGELYFRLLDASSGHVGFPTLCIGKCRSRYSVISFEDQRQLVGQTCQMWGRPLRFSFQDRIQVFALECNKGGRLGFDEAFKDYEKSFQNRTSFTSFSIVILIWLFGVLLFFWVESYANRKVRLVLQTPSSSTASSKAQP